MVDVVWQEGAGGRLASHPTRDGIFEALGVGVGVSAQDGRLVDVNDALLALLGCTREDALGRSVDELLGSDLAVGGALDGVDQRIRVFERADGRRTWLRITVTHLRESSGTVHAVEDLTDLKVAEGVLRARALLDPVTGLPNRYLAQDRLQHALASRARGGRKIAVVFVDLDGFKRVNDTAGHRAGDEVLREAGRRIAACARPSDTVARWAGDEFVVLLDGVGDEREAERIAERIVATCAAPFVAGDHVLSLGASVGLALTPPGGPVGPAELLDRADRAMYADKHRRRRG